MTDLRTAAQQALEALLTYEQYIQPLTNHFGGPRVPEEGSASAKVDAAITALRAALAEPVQEPVAWMHNLIDDNIITHRPADIDRHPDRWTALYPEPKPCPTCEALARTVMMDQTSHDTAPPQRKPLTEEEIKALIDSVDGLGIGRHVMHKIARAIERAHGIGS